MFIDNLLKIFSIDEREKKTIKRIIYDNSKKHIDFLSSKLGERTIRKYEKLNSARDYIKKWFDSYNLNLIENTYIADNHEVANIIVEIKGYEQPENIILIAAHYDTVEDSPGADDNASGISALIEIARMISPIQHKKTLRIAAYTLEEPPYFTTELMGSVRHASKCKQLKENIELMISLDMIGYGGRYCKEDHPTDDIKKISPRHGDYLGVYSLPSYSKFTDLWSDLYEKHADEKIYPFTAPASISGIYLSDHRSFIENGFPAIMISDLGYYRNKNYHTPDDTCNTINYKFLSNNIYNICKTLLALLNYDSLNLKNHN
jgi:Zn-dependent M28 family amino/carboxypeptidase